MKAKRFAEEVSSVMSIIHASLIRQQPNVITKGKMGFPQIVVVEFLKNNGACKMSDISDMLHVTKSAVTNIVDRLIEDGIIKRNRSSKDRRVVWVRLTPKGDRVARQVMDFRKKMIEKLFFFYQSIRQSAISPNIEKNEDKCSSQNKRRREMKNKFVIILILSMVFSSQEAWPQEGKEVLLSLTDCLNEGLAHNLDIKIAKIESKIAGQDVILAESLFDTILAGKVSYADDQLAQSTIILGEHEITTDYEAGLTKKFITGSELSVDYSDNRTWTDSVFAADRSLHTANLSMSLRQPVLKNFFGYVDRRTVKLSKIEAAIASVESKGRIEDSVADIEKAYWKLVFEYERVLLQEDLLKQAEDLFNIYQNHLKTGFAEETDVLETEANMRIRKTQLEIAQNQLITASNNLRLLLDSAGGHMIVPKDRLGKMLGTADLIESLNEAFAFNRSYKITKKNLEAKDVVVKMKKNSLWPEVDLVGTFAVNGVDAKFEKANRRLMIDKHSYYYGGIEVSMPLENRQARGEHAKATLEKEKAIIEMVQVEKEIATSIDEKVRDVNLYHENARHWAKIKDIQKTKFAEEEKKLAHGRSSSKIVIDYQRDFMLAAIEELGVLLQYYYAMIDLENEKDALLRKVGVIG